MRIVWNQLPAVALFVCSAASAGVAQQTERGVLGTVAQPWSQVAVDGGDVLDIAVSPVDAQLVYAAEGGAAFLDGALYRSTDGAQSWARVTAVPRSGFDALAFAQDGRLYAGSRNGVFVGSIDGSIWINRSNGLPAGVGVRSLAVDNNDPLHVWAALDFHASGWLYETNDGGENWIARMPPVTGNSNGRAVVLHPTNPDIVIAVFTAFSAERVWVSTNGGDTWTDRSSGMLPMVLEAAHFDGTRLLVGGGSRFQNAQAGLFSSTNLGETFDPLSPTTFQSMAVTDIAVKPGNANVIVVGTDRKGLLRSTNGGNNWTAGVGGTGGANPAGQLPSEAVYYRPGDSTRLYIGAMGHGVFVSSDDGSTIAHASRGIRELAPTRVAAHPANPNRLAMSFTAFSAPVGGGMLESTDQGASWTEIGALRVRPTAVSYDGSGVIHATSIPLYRNDAGGWVSIGPNTVPTQLLLAVVTRPETPGVVIAGGYFNGAQRQGVISRSSNAGQTWSEALRLSLNTRITAIETVEDGTGLNLISLAQVETVGGGLLINRSIDGGASWLAPVSGLPATGLALGAVCTSRAVPGLAYLSAVENGNQLAVFRSTDGGANWQRRGAFASTIAASIACDRFAGDRLYLGQSNFVARSSDGGLSFESTVDGLSDPQITHLVTVGGSAQTQRLYALGRGAWVQRLGDILFENGFE